MAFIDIAQSTGEYKLLQLRQCLSGEALNVSESLGLSTAAYEAAMSDWSRDIEVSAGKSQYILRTWTNSHK